MEKYFIMLILCAIGGIIFTVVTHETAHYMMFKHYGAKFHELKIGFFVIFESNGKKKVRLAKKGEREFSISGIREEDYKWNELFFILLAGPLINLITGLFVCIIFDDFLICWYFGIIPLFVGLFNILPIPFDAQSDGCRMMRLLNKSSREYEVLDYNIVKGIVLNNEIKYKDLAELSKSSNNVHKCRCYFYRYIMDDSNNYIKKWAHNEQSKIKAAGCKTFRI